jgi:hypothetical protein
MLRKKFSLIVFVFFISSISLFSQSRQQIDSLQLVLKGLQGEDAEHVKMDLARLYYMSRPDSTVLLSEQVLAYALKNDNPFLQEKALVRLAIGNYVLGDLDTAIHFANAATEINSKTLDTNEMEFALNLLSVTYKRKDDLPKALEYGYKTLNIRRKRGDSLSIAASLGNMSAVLMSVGDFEKATDFAYEALSIYEAKHDTIGVVGRLITLVHLMNRSGNDEHEYETIYRGIHLLKNIDFPYLKADLIGSLSIYFISENQWDSALYYEQKALSFYKQINNPESVAQSYSSLGRIYSQLGDRVLALKYHHKSIQLLRRNNYLSLLYEQYENIGRYHLGLQRLDSAQFYFQKAYDASSKKGQMQTLKFAAKGLYLVYKQRGQVKNALDYHEIYTQLNDSLSGISSKKKLLEFEVRYESLKKDQEIKLLRLDQEKHRLENEVLETRQRNLWVSIIALAIVFIMILVMVLVKRKKDNMINLQNQQLLEKDKKLAESKLEQSRIKEKELNTQLEYKSKQLTSHALNMMQKNQFLQDLEEELAALSKKADDNLKAKMRSLKSALKRHNRSDKDWELFKNYFEEVNVGFYDELSQRFPELSSNDYKICALLKLNMNIKESASVLNISPESVKTARYRLRKKLKLETGEDLYTFIQNI